MSSCGMLKRSPWRHLMSQLRRPYKLFLRAMLKASSSMSDSVYDPYRSVAMLVMHFGHRDPEMHSHDATSYYAAIRPASAALDRYAARSSSNNDFTPGCVACF